MQDNDLPQIGTPMQTDETQALIEPWADYHGDLPDYDHPMRCVFESGVQYTVELLAKELKVTDWTPCDGTEEYDGDLGGTLMNIVLAAMPKDEHGDPVYPRDLPALSSPTLHPSDREEGVERVAQAIADIKGGLNYDYMDFCRDAARAAILALSGSLAPANPTEKGEL